MPGEAVREAGSRPPAAVHAWTPRDRYDPELFNRRFHPSPPVR
jgi:hypothetical protein